VRTIEITFRALEQFPGKRTINKKRATFRSSYCSTLSLLKAELAKIRASEVILQADCDASEIRQDGMLRANARIRTSAIVLAFSSPKGPLSFPCDRYSDWQDNVRAIALSLKALRDVDRYGVTQGNEQYKGWAKIGGPGPTDTSVMSVEDAARIIARASNESGTFSPTLVGSIERYRQAYRSASAKLHPDNQNTGNAAEFVKLQQAAAILDKHHGI